jgi:NADPH-dependent ferric siderophore reductase
VNLLWLERGDAPPGDAARLTTAADEVEWPGTGRGHAYVAGEMRVVRAVSAALGHRGLERDQVSAKAYWRSGGPNAAHGEPLDPDRAPNPRR